ncbi:hypothetical protein [Labrys wisconsinensis]|uniref:Uncharacterized protein n=1 Tax=Labrys wisconsinensis TaxID=425677 RepID=A0ABU0J9L7_9HYPH|nr:hypothetical protein [Labrys wisconsinensis]MDQ0469964.1 hypothetical protein [Labrys wisconsinensis]
MPEPSASPARRIRGDAEVLAAARAVGAGGLPAPAGVSVARPLTRRPDG